LFVLLQYPENYSPQPGEEVLGVGYANEESEHHFFVTGDSSRWIKVSMNCRVLLDPVLADRVPGVVTLRAEEEHPEEEPVQELGIFAAPNPFNPATRIELYLPRATKGNVKVFDIRGRLVKELFSGELAQGNISFVWRGKDGYGRSMASGAYYVKVATGNGSFTQKLLLIK
jgi:hypothetical protein